MLYPGFAGYPTADVHAGGLVMLAGGDLIMTALAIALAVPLVGGDRRDRGQREAASADLAAYNASLALLTGSGPRDRAGLIHHRSPR